MHSDTRNTKVIASLVAAMTVGAAMLMWLEAPSPALATAQPLTARVGPAVTSLTIEFAPAGAWAGSPEAYDCIVAPDAAPYYDVRQDRGGSAWMLVIGESGDQLSDQHALQVLKMLGLLHQQHQLAWRDIRFPVGTGHQQAEQLRELLIRKGMLQ